MALSVRTRRVASRRWKRITRRDKQPEEHQKQDDRRQQQQQAKR
jgi:hypothetical protein